MSQIDPNEFEDFTGRMGQLGREIKGEWPMYSYERPAWNYWNGVANYLKSVGCTDAEIGEILRHKYMRWMLDHDDHAIQSLGFETASQFFEGKKPK